MAILANFPMVSQLTPVTSDGRPSENAQYDCVPASIGAGILWYQGKHAWDQEVNPDHLKDQAYGEALRNSGTAATAYVDVVAKMGFRLFPINGDPAQLVQHVREQLDLQHPVVFTEPDPYVPASFGWSHVCVFWRSDPGTLTCLDPYIAKAIIRDDAEWQRMLLFNQIWILEKLEENVAIDIHNAEVARYFEQITDHQWKCKGNGKIVQYAILDAYKKWGNSALCGLTYLGLPESNEIPLATVPGAVKQHFERGVLVYDVSHKVDGPPGAGDVYAAHLYDGGVGQDPLIKDLNTEIAHLQAQPPVAPATPPIVQGQVLLSYTASQGDIIKVIK